jgi:hypothetical protein
LAAKAKLLLFTNTLPLADPSASQFLAFPESSWETALIWRNSCSKLFEKVVVVPFAA